MLHGHEGHDQYFTFQQPGTCSWGFCQFLSWTLWQVIKKKYFNVIFLSPMLVWLHTLLGMPVSHMFLILRQIQLPRTRGILLGSLPIFFLAIIKNYSKKALECENCITYARLITWSLGYASVTHVSLPPKKYNLGLMLSQIHTWYTWYRV